MTSLYEAPLPTGVERATRVRYGVVALAVLLAVVTYLDRVCISKLAPEIMRDLRLSEYQMSFVFSAFTMAYAVFEIPTARWADRWGTRRVLTRIVVWWSSFTIATAGALGYGSLLVIRFLFGMGEAGAWPSVTSTFSRWIPAKERGTVQGIFFTGAHLSGGLTPMLVTVLMGYLPWRAIFVLFGLVGFVWAAAWYLWFRDDPSQHTRVNEAERRLIVGGRKPAAPHHASWQYWLRLVTHRNTWPLCLMYIANVCAYFFCITWLPTYLEKQYGLTAMQLGVAAGMPLTLSVLGDLFGGVITDRMTRRFGLWVGRCGVGATAYGLAGLAMYFAAATEDPLACVVLLSLAVAAAMFTLGAAWATCIDIGGNHSGVVSATMNTAGNGFAMLVPFCTIFLKDRFSTWDAPLYAMSGLFVLGTICWCLLDPRKRVFD
jgi:ACS family glucarate transporter-like MFS transporter